MAVFGFRYLLNGHHGVHERGAVRGGPKAGRGYAQSPQRSSCPWTAIGRPKSSDDSRRPHHHPYWCDWLSLVPPLPQDKARALDNQQALDRESAYCHSFGSREMSELWLPRWHCPFLFWPRGGRKRRVGFWTWDCGWLMAINSISHLSSLPHYWVVAGLSWWVLPCCCEAGLLEEGASKEQRRSAAEEAATACSDVRSTAEQQQGSTHQLNPPTTQ